MKKFEIYVVLVMLMVLGLNAYGAVIDLADHLDGGAGATYGHSSNNYPDSNPADDMPDDAYYADNVWLDSVGPVRPGGWRSITPQTGWVVWAFDAPVGMKIKGFNFTYGMHIDPTHCAGSSVTYYYNTGTYAGTADPDIVGEGWTQFGQSTVATSSSTISDIDVTDTNRLYVAFKLDRVIVAGQTAGFWDMDQGMDNYEFDLVTVTVIDLADHLNAGDPSSATYGHSADNYLDSNPADDMPDDAYYADNVWLDTAGPVRPGGWRSTTPQTGWVVWAFDAPVGMQIDGFDFTYGMHIDTTHCAGSSVTYYYNTDTYAGTADPDIAGEGWTQFGQSTVATSSSTISDIDVTDTNRLYVAFKLDRVIVAGQTANFWDMGQKMDNYEFLFVPEPMTISLLSFGGLLMIFCRRRFKKPRV